jgi:hypothetical protein
MDNIFDVQNEELNDLYCSPNIVRGTKMRNEMGPARCMYGEGCIQGFGGETWGKETTGETQAQMGG